MSPSTDPLTGLYVPYVAQRFAPEQAAPWIADVPRDIVLIWIGLRDFGRVNNEHGVRAGDQVMAEIGRRLRAAANPWPAYRYGGDEFLVVSRRPDESAIRAFVATLRAELERPHGALGTVRTWAAAVRAGPGSSLDQLNETLLVGASQAVTKNRWSGLLVAPVGSDRTATYAEPVE
jgi:diguanylate cyclase (GGDEF)-like protein